LDALRAWLAAPLSSEKRAPAPLEELL
jgi:hypothetical protein